ncbi:MAG TPA: 16S rRNA (cytosine(967)-C(5))-methyltransferase RsmB, partial [Bacteroidetes bacterium]|nr:16S rRNA (cytosine(967)-C(5))-methyltransferase RsmB [Bacteroidota bacterium]HEX04545.1 16S rRNA (cytosine(967)-C(5))-methyltransferase RsmB [Bacteroidota bacterium]
VLVYSTCSLESSENEKRVQIFDKRAGEEMKRDQLPDSIPDILRKEVGMAATWPPRDRVDGAFIARWKRTK